MSIVLMMQSYSFVKMPFLAALTLHQPRMSIIVTGATSPTEPKESVDSLPESMGLSQRPGSGEHVRKS